MRITRMAAIKACVLGLFLCAAGGVPAANADVINIRTAGESEPLSSTPRGGFDSVFFAESPGKGTSTSGYVERGGAIIATAPALAPGEANRGGVPGLEVVLAPGDVVHLDDPRVPGGMSTTFSGYPTVSDAQCGSSTVRGMTAPGQPAIAALFALGNSPGGTAGTLVNTGSEYTATFPKPIPPGDFVYITTSYSPSPGFVVFTTIYVRDVGPCIQAAPPQAPNPATSTQKCVVPNLKHKKIAQARKLLARAHCKLGKVRRPSQPVRHKLMIRSQQPVARKKLATNTQVNVRLG
jgi:hypothetical protein